MKPSLFHKIRSQRRFPRTRPANQRIRAVPEGKRTAVERQNPFLQKQNAHTAAQNIQTDIIRFGLRLGAHFDDASAMDTVNRRARNPEQDFAVRDAEMVRDFRYGRPAFRKLAPDNRNAAKQISSFRGRQFRQGKSAVNMQTKRLVGEVLDGTGHTVHPTVC